MYYASTRFANYFRFQYMLYTKHPDKVVRGISYCMLRMYKQAEDELLDENGYVVNVVKEYIEERQKKIRNLKEIRLDSIDALGYDYPEAYLLRAKAGLNKVEYMDSSFRVDNDIINEQLVDLNESEGQKEREVLGKLSNQDNGDRPAILADQNRPMEDIQLYFDLMKYTDVKDEDYHLWGVLYYNKGNYNNVKKDLNSKDSTLWNFYTGIAAHHLGNYPKALTYLSQLGLWEKRMKKPASGSDIVELLEGVGLDKCIEGIEKYDIYHTLAKGLLESCYQLNKENYYGNVVKEKYLSIQNSAPKKFKKVSRYVI
jgi:hypothetical protein